MSDIPPPTRQRKRDPPAGEHEHERLATAVRGPWRDDALEGRVGISPGAFFAEQKALVDERKEHLARLGMTPQQVAALRMPDLAERPMRPDGTPDLLPVHAEEQEELPGEYKPKRIKGDLPARHDLEEGLE